MKLEVLISTMNRNNIDFLNELNLHSDSVVVNQNNNYEGIETIDTGKYCVKLVNSIDRGLSKSRNLAIQNSEADICIIADDDITYDDDYVETVKKAHKNYPSADIIAFQVERTNSKTREKTFRKEKTWENYLTSMKISSVEITFKRKSIVNNNILFNTDFGAGTYYSHGEENIFLYECLKKGLKILYLPIKIAEVDASESTWFQGFTEQYFYTVGAKFYNMSSIYYHALILQFAIRKQRLYRDQYSLTEAIKLMYDGVKQYKLQD